MNGALIMTLLAISVFFTAMILLRFVLAIARFIQKKILVRQGRIIDIRYYSFRSRLLKTTLLLIGSVWCIRFAVGYYSIFFPATPGETVLSPAEEIFNSLVHTLQTFSLDEQYSTYITKGKEMINYLFDNHWLLSDIYGIYVAVLNFAVPVAGGALLFELISEFFPRVHLFFADLVIWKDKYYFSNLNEKSLAMAKSIMTSTKAKPFLIFTDVNTDSEDGCANERIASAKTLGGICVKDDLLHIKLSRLRNVRIFLIDESENVNLQTLASLLEKTSSVIRRSDIYVFSSENVMTNSDKEVSFLVDQKIEKIRLENIKKKKTKKQPEEYLPNVLPVNGLRHLASNLFICLPLFEPIIDKPTGENGRKKLTVTILGSGAVGTEFFLTTYWCGQMLDTDLHINVVSNEKQNAQSDYPGEGDFEGKINNINPEIFKTADESSNLLKYSDNEPGAEVYFNYSYYESDVLVDDFTSLIENTDLIDTDYYIVALGSDEENFCVADKLRQIVGRNHIGSDRVKNTVISYIIYNPELCKSLNNNCFYKYSNASEVSDLIMVAFGNLEEIYGVGNIFFEEMPESAFQMGKRYNLRKNIKGKNNRKRIENVFSYQCDFAKRIHRKYKEYSCGFHKKSVFYYGDFDKPFDEELHTAKLSYIKYVTTEKLNSEGKTKEKLDRLAWLEHRRWCAHMRTKGYQIPSDAGERYFESAGSVNNESALRNYYSLKINPCLAECSKSGINAEMDEYGFIKTQTEFKSYKISDKLDLLSVKLHEKCKKEDDFKRWDYPEFDITAQDIKLLLESEHNISSADAKRLKNRYL